MDKQDRDWIKRLNSGDQEAWIELCERLLALARTILSRYYKGQELEQNSEDAAQQAAALIFEHLDQCKVAFCPWVKSILRNTTFRLPLFKLMRALKRALRSLLTHLSDEDPRLQMQVREAISGLSSVHKCVLERIIDRQETLADNWKQQYVHTEAIWALTNEASFVHCLWRFRNRSRRASKVLQRINELANWSPEPLPESPDGDLALLGNVQMPEPGSGDLEDLIEQLGLELDPWELLQILSECLERLRDVERKIIEGRYGGEQRLAEIARREGWNENTVKVNHWRACRKLKQCIEEKSRER